MTVSFSTKCCVSVTQKVSLNRFQVNECELRSWDGGRGTAAVPSPQGLRPAGGLTSVPMGLFLVSDHSLCILAEFPSQFRDIWAFPPSARTEHWKEQAGVDRRAEPFLQARSHPGLLQNDWQSSLLSPQCLFYCLSPNKQ